MSRHIHAPIEFTTFDNPDESLGLAPGFLYAFAETFNERKGIEGLLAFLAVNPAARELQQLMFLAKQTEFDDNPILPPPVVCKPGFVDISTKKNELLAPYIYFESEEAFAAFSEKTHAVITKLHRTDTVSLVELSYSLLNLVIMIYDCVIDIESGITFSHNEAEGTAVIRLKPLDANDFEYEITTTTEIAKLVDSQIQQIDPYDYNTLKTFRESDAYKILANAYAPIYKNGKAVKVLAINDTAVISDIDLHSMSIKPTIRASHSTEDLTQDDFWEKIKETYNLKNDLEKNRFADLVKHALVNSSNRTVEGLRPSQSVAFNIFDASGELPSSLGNINLIELLLTQRLNFFFYTDIIMHGMTAHYTSLKLIHEEELERNPEAFPRLSENTKVGLILSTGKIITLTGKEQILAVYAILLEPYQLELNPLWEPQLAARNTDYDQFYASQLLQRDIISQEQYDDFLDQVSPVDPSEGNPTGRALVERGLFTEVRGNGQTSSSGSSQNHAADGEGSPSVNLIPDPLPTREGGPEEDDGCCTIL